MLRQMIKKKIVNIVRQNARHFNKKGFNQPVTANEMPRPGGIASFMRLPIQATAQGLDVCFLGVPLDTGASNRPGTRFGPRQIRTESVLLRACNSYTGTAPFQHVQVADVGDVPITMYDLNIAITEIRQFVSDVLAQGCTPLTMGGDHTITYPILQAIKDHIGPVALIHVDAHSDTGDTMKGCRICHGTTFRRAVEEGLLQTDKVYQIGLRGSRYTLGDLDFPRNLGFKLILAEDCWHKSLTPLMKQIRSEIGNTPVYISLDIDALDPAYAAGTGTPEIGGLTTIQMLEIIRGSKGLNIVGGDLVEVSPPYDTTGNTALTAANLLFEMLCALPKIK